MKEKTLCVCVCVHGRAIYVCPSRASSVESAAASQQATLKQALFSEKSKSTLFYTHTHTRAHAHTRTPVQSGS